MNLGDWGRALFIPGARVWSVLDNRKGICTAIILRPGEITYAVMWESQNGEAAHSEFELSGEPDYRDSGQESAGEDKQA
jgi:hypothetical protein